MKKPGWIRAIADFFKGSDNKEAADSSAPDGKSERIILAIDGMSCVSCERRIEGALSGKNGVERVSVSYGDASATITYRPEIISLKDLVSEIERIGYSARPKTGGRTGASAEKRKREGFSPLQLAGIAGIIIVVWLILDRTGIFYAIPQINQNMGYGLLFIVGLLTSLHCVAMCGGINLSQSTKGIDNPDAPVKKRLLPGLLYNAGRLISYTAIGGIVGTIGSIVSLSGNLQGVIVIVAGGFMILMGINMLNVFPWLKKLTPRLPRALSNKIAGKVSGKGPLFVGLLNGFMPCGPLQSMQLYALATGSFIAGAFSMLLFALGTIPLMFGFGAITSLLSKRFSTRMMKISALLVLFLGAGMISRGFSLSGLGINLSSPTGTNIARIDGDIQQVSSRVTSSSYEPIVVQAGIPVRWTIEVKESDLNGCNNPLTIPSFNIKKKLAAGPNTIEFVPTASGNITFTCWMGMITSRIVVVDDISRFSETDLGALQKSGGSAGGGCCAGSASNGGSSAIQDAFFPQIDIPTAVFLPSEIRDGVQYITISIGTEGYSPAVGVVQRGMKVKLVFYGETLNQDNYQMIVPAYDARFQIAQGDNIIEFVPEIDFFFQNWTSRSFGAILVVDDLKAIDHAEIEERINRLKEPPQQPAAAAGGGVMEADSLPAK